MLEGPYTWKEFLTLYQPKVSTAVGKTAVILFKMPHEYQTVAQASEHVDSLSVLKLFELYFKFVFRLQYFKGTQFEWYCGKS